MCTEEVSILLLNKKVVSNIRSGSDTSLTFALEDKYIPKDLYGPIGINDRYCILAAWDDNEPSIQHVSPPIYIHVPYPTTTQTRRRRRGMYAS